LTSTMLRRPSVLMFEDSRLQCGLSFVRKRRQKNRLVLTVSSLDLFVIQGEHFSPNFWIFGDNYVMQSKIPGKASYILSLPEVNITTPGTRSRNLRELRSTFVINTLTYLTMSATSAQIKTDHCQVSVWPVNPCSWTVYYMIL
jgi:hypothetical protein